MPTLLLSSFASFWKEEREATSLGSFDFRRFLELGIKALALVGQRDSNLRQMTLASSAKDAVETNAVTVNVPSRADDVDKAAVMMRNHVEWRKTAVPGGMDEVNIPCTTYVVLYIPSKGPLVIPLLPSADGLDVSHS